MFKKNKKSNIKGFTLVEVLVTIVVISLLVTGVTVFLGGARQKTSDFERLTAIEDIRDALFYFYSDVGYYPSEISSGHPIVNPDTGKVYLDSVPEIISTKDVNCSFTGFNYNASEDGEYYTINYCLSQATNDIEAGDVIANPDDTMCVPECDGKECIDDNGCGSTCEDYCHNNIASNECTPDCSGKVCGNDGCEGSCGSCSDSQICIDNSCEANLNEIVFGDMKVALFDNKYWAVNNQGIGLKYKQVSHQNFLGGEPTWNSETGIYTYPDDWSYPIFEYCENLGGDLDFRVPTINELEKLLQGGSTCRPNCLGEPPYTDLEGVVGDSTNDRYWSSTEYQSLYARTIIPYLGTVGGSNKKNTFRVICVHDCPQSGCTTVIDSTNNEEDIEGLSGDSGGDNNFVCGTTEVAHSGITYGTISAGDTCWLDRNLGASRKAVAKNDTSAFGDYYQWGRLTDGHEKRGSELTSTKSTTIVPGHNKFILSGSSNWLSIINNNLWQGADGTNSPCPSGWEVPSKSDWESVVSTLDINGSNYFESDLKMVQSGFRGSTGSNASSAIPMFWTSDFVDNNNAIIFNITSSFSSGKAYGMPIRCIKK